MRLARVLVMLVACTFPGLDGAAQDPRLEAEAQGPGIDAHARGPRIETRRGGWQGGPTKLICYTRAGDYEALLTNTEAVLSISGQTFEPAFLTFIPEGFVMSNWVDGRFYTYRIEPQGWRLQITDHDAPGGPTERWIACELCPWPEKDQPRQDLGLLFTLPGGEWCPSFYEESLGYRFRYFTRRVVDLADRRAADGVLTPAEDGHIFAATIGVGGTREAGREITSGSELRDFIEAQMSSGRMAARQAPGWVTVLVGPFEGQPGFADMVVDSWRFGPDPDPSHCVSFELRMHWPGGGRSIRQKRRACLHPERWVAFAGVFADTRLIGDAEADGRVESPH